VTRVFLGYITLTTAEMKGLARDIVRLGYNVVFAAGSDGRWAVWAYELWP